jgi:cobalt-zinc-cadmium efflux system outer membrane protein
MARIARRIALSGCRWRGRAQRFLVAGLAGLVLASGPTGCGGSAAFRGPGAGELVAQRTGHRPAWDEAWETLSSGWDADGVLTEEEAVALALRNNRALRADLELIGQAEADLVQAGLLTNPMFSLMAMLPSGGGRAMLRGSTSLLPLEDLWLIPERKKVAAAAMQETVLRVADRAVETTREVRVSYARLRFAQRAIALLEETIVIAGRSIRILETRQSTGKATQVQLNVSRVREMRLRSELATMHAMYRGEQRGMLQLIGFPAASDAWSVTPLDELTDELTPSVDEAEVVMIGAAQRLDLLAAEWSLMGAARDLKLTKREGWPEVSVGLAFERAPAPKSDTPSVPARVGNAAAQAAVNQYYGVPATDGVPTVSPFGPKTREVKWTVGPSFDVELPIFDRNQAQVARAVHEFNRRLAMFEDRAHAVIRGIREAYIRQELARSQLALYRSTILPEVTRNLELSHELLTVGREDLTVLLDVEQDLVMTRMKTLEFLRDFLVSRAELQREAGGRLPEDPPAVEGEVVDD